MIIIRAICCRLRILLIHVGSDRFFLLRVGSFSGLANDISKGSYGFPKVRQTLAGAHGILTSTAYLRAGMMSSRREGRSVKLRGQYQSEDLSILSSIMGITQEVSCSGTAAIRHLIQPMVL
jgi:hypothetical protein